MKAADLVQQLQTGTDQQRMVVIQAMLERLSVSENSIQLAIAIAPLRTLMAMPSQAETADALGHTITIAMRLKRCGGVSRLIIGGERAAQAASQPNRVLLKAVAKAFAWQHQLLTNVDATPSSIADTEGVTASYVARVLHLAALAPDIVEAIVEGRHPVELSLDGIMEMLPLPLDWSAQWIALGFS